MKPSELKRGHVVRWKDGLWRIQGSEHTKPGKGPALYQMTMKNLSTGRVLTNRFSTHDDLEFVNIDSRRMQYLYRDGDLHVFMDNETYEQLMIADADIAEEIGFIKDNQDVRVNLVDGKPISLDLPAAVVLEVVECDPGARGDTVSNVFKPAKLETGLQVKVPLHINKGDTIKVDTRSGEFLERASK